MRHALVPALCLVGLLAVSGCSSISDTVTSPSRWLGDSSRALGDSSQGSADSSDAFSRSSSSDDEESESEARYRDDVRLAARAWATGNPAPGQPEALAREIGDIAEHHGLLDWPTAQATWTGVARGLREAGVDAARVEHVLEALGRREAARPSGPAG